MTQRNKRAEKKLRSWCQTLIFYALLLLNVLACRKSNPQWEEDKRKAKPLKIHSDCFTQYSFLHFQQLEIRQIWQDTQSDSKTLYTYSIWPHFVFVGSTDAGGEWYSEASLALQSLSWRHRSVAMGTYLKRKSMTHIWPSHLFCHCLKAWNVCQSAGVLTKHTHTDSGSCTSSLAKTHNQQTLSDPPLSSFCNPSIFLSRQSTVKTFWK